MRSKKTRSGEKERRPRRSFTDDFRRDVVRLCQAGDESISEVASRLDLTESAVRNWVKKAAQEAQVGGAKAGVTTSEREELQRLRREVKTLKMERDILKKAAKFFARESP